jgi:environmental stress-induced protein Ves
MQILYARDRVVSPWKNGGGTTTEVAAFPPGASLENFGWRVSIAQVARGGPFSQFPGIDRTLAMLDGRMALTIAGRGIFELSADTPPVAFPGDVATGAALVAGPVTDLNVMTRRGAFTARMTRHRGAIAFDTATAFAFPLAAVTVRCQNLVPGDALFADAPENVSLPPDCDSFWVEILAAGDT